MADHRLTSEHLRLIGRVLAPFADRIELAGLFGSRATGHARPNSDVDLVLFGTLSVDDIALLWEAFDESDLPMTVDVVAYHLIDYAPFRDHIDRVLRPLFSRADLVSSFAVQEKAAERIESA